VINNELTLVKSVEEDAYNLPFYSTITKEYNEKKVVTKKRVEIDENEINQNLKFKLKNGKTALLFERDKNLYYAFLDKDNNVEFSMAPVYNETIEGIEVSFVLIDAKDDRRELNFNTEDARYAIYQITKNGHTVDVGITVDTKGKKYDLAGLPDTVEGNLDGLAVETFENVWVARKVDSQFALDLYDNYRRMTPTQLTAAWHHSDFAGFLREVPNGKDSDRFNEYLEKLKQAFLSKDKYRLLPLIDKYYLTNQVIFNGFTVSEMLHERILRGYNSSVSEAECKLQSRHYSEVDGCEEFVNLDDIQDVEMELSHVDWYSGVYLLILDVKKTDGTSVKLELFAGKDVGDDGEVKFMIFSAWG
jgi:hypothetical protein